MPSNYSLLRELADLIAKDYIDIEASQKRIVGAVLADKLDADPVFEITTVLASFGPKNDYDGTRSAANRVLRDWEEKVLHPALYIASKIKRASFAKLEEAK